MIEWHGDEVQQQIQARITANMLKLGSTVVLTASVLAPKRTGELSRSIGFDWNAESFTLVFTVDAPYGMFVEYGTRHMRPQPYLRRALEQVGPIYGFNTEMAFANVPSIHDPLLAAGPTFRVPKSLTAKQRQHVKEHLVPASKGLWSGKSGNVRRTAMNLRKHF